MDAQADNQLELFSQSGNSASLKRSHSRPFFAYIRGYEKTILIILGVVIMGVISFSLGVEKGKRLTMQKLTDFQPTPQKAITEEAPKADISPKQEVLPPVIREEVIQVKAAAPQIGRANYTIQLASYKTRTSAQREAEVLKKKGFMPIVLAKGNYIVLCVGKFSNKEKALTLLASLQARYKGCYIRRL